MIDTRRARWNAHFGKFAQKFLETRIFVGLTLTFNGQTPIQRNGQKATEIREPSILNFVCASKEHKKLSFFFVVAFLEQPFQKGDGTSILPSSRTLRLLQQLSTLFPKRLSKTSSFPSLHPIRVRVVEKTSISHTNPPEEFSFIHYLCCGLI